MGTLGKRSTAQPSFAILCGTLLFACHERRSIDGGVGGNDPINPSGHSDIGHFPNLIILKIWGNF